MITSIKKKAFSKLIFFLFFLCVGTQAQNTTHTYTKTDGPNKNPMKGWNSGWWNNFEHASVGFQYIKWNVFEPTEGNFDYDAVETIINRPGSQGRHLILRLFTDWYGENAQSDGAPSWLADNYGVERFQYTNQEGLVKYVTNYNHTEFINKAIIAIEELSNHFNDDPRIYAFQLGMIGYWGEWHNSSYNDPNFEIEYDTKIQILNTYKNNFENTHIMGRYPWRKPLDADNTIGYHNDFFKPNNGHSDSFDDAVFDNEKWLNGPIGGEIPPIEPEDIDDFNTDLFGTPEGLNMINRGHYSTMQSGNANSPCLNNPTSTNCNGFMAMHRKMGYNFQIENAIFNENLTQTDNLTITLNIENIGVAPIYYDWKLQFALIDENDQPVEIYSSNYDLRSVVSDNNLYSISHSNSLNNIPLGNYRLVVRIIQPNADTNKNELWKLDARNTYILFSNDIDVINGQWNSNNALVGGWSILGNINVVDETFSLNRLEILKNNVKLYPNPSKNLLNIYKTIDIRLESVTIYDITGRKIQMKKLDNTFTPNVSLDISFLLPGTYLAIIDSEYGTIKQPFIKK